MYTDYSVSWPCFVCTDCVFSLLPPQATDTFIDFGIECFLCDTLKFISKEVRNIPPLANVCFKVSVTNTNAQVLQK